MEVRGEGNKRGDPARPESFRVRGGAMAPALEALTEGARPGRVEDDGGEVKVNGLVIEGGPGGRAVLG